MPDYIIFIIPFLVIFALIKLIPFFEKKFNESDNKYDERGKAQRIEDIKEAHAELEKNEVGIIGKTLVFLALGTNGKKKTSAMKMFLIPVGIFALLMTPVFLSFSTDGTTDSLFLLLLEFFPCIPTRAQTCSPTGMLSGIIFLALLFFSIWLYKKVKSKKRSK